MCVIGLYLPKKTHQTCVAVCCSVLQCAAAYCNVCDRPLLTRKTTPELDTFSTKEPYCLSQEPYYVTEEHYLMAKLPYHMATEPYCPSKEPYVYQKSPLVYEKSPMT